ncbi:MAG: SurA N-terminal domain-containing protein [Parahaliea sp.]
MLQDIRKNTQSPAIKIIVWVIVIAFAGFGIESILLGGGSSGVAEVNGENISQQEVQQMAMTQKRRLIAMLGDNLDPALLDDAQLESQSIQTIINRRLLAQAADEMKLSISEAELGRIIGAMEAFQIDGKFNAEMYKNRIAEAGFTPAGFKAGLREDLLIGQARSGLVDSEFATPAELELSARIASEQRDIRYATIPQSKFDAAVVVSDEQIQAYYSAHEAQFYSQESVVLDYIELRAKDFEQPPKESDVLSMYEQEKAGYQYQNENRVSHILLTQGDDEASPAYLARIAEVKSALDGGADFAELARQYSDDIATATGGGDLGYSQGDAFPQEMEDAIAGLEVNSPSGPVETNAGNHFWLVTDRREGDAPTLDEMRPELERRIRESDARQILLAKVETLRDLAFNALDLSEPARELALEVKSSEAVLREGNSGLFLAPALVSAAYSEDVLELGHNSEVIELSPDQFVVLRVNKHNQPALQPLSDVREIIVAAVQHDEVQKALTAAAQDILAAIREGQSMEAAAKAQGYDWQLELGAERRSAMIPAAVSAAAFALPAPAEGSSASDYTISPAGDAYVLEVSKVTPGSYSNLAAPRQQMIKQQVGLEYSQLLQQEYQQELRAQADITIY